MKIEQAVESFSREVRWEQSIYDTVGEHTQHKFDVHQCILNYLKEKLK